MLLRSTSFESIKVFLKNRNVGKSLILMLLLSFKIFITKVTNEIRLVQIVFLITLNFYFCSFMLLLVMCLFIVKANLWIIFLRKVNWSSFFVLPLIRTLANCFVTLEISAFILTLCIILNLSYWIFMCIAFFFNLLITISISEVWGERQIVGLVWINILHLRGMIPLKAL